MSQKELRVLLDAEKQARTTSVQTATVLAEKLMGIEARLTDTLAREKQTVVKLIEVEQQAKAAEALAQLSLSPI